MELPIIRLRSFLGIAKIRLIQPYGGSVPYIPIVDIAAAIDHPRRKVLAIVKRNAEDFQGEVFSARLFGTPGGSQNSPSIVPLDPPFRPDASHGGRSPERVMCMSYEGMIGLLFMIEASRVKNDLKRRRIIAFRKWAKKIVARAILDFPPDQIPAELSDLLELRCGKELSAGVHKLAVSTGRHIGTVRRWIRKARALRGEPATNYRPRRDRVEVTAPDEVERLRQFHIKNPRATTAEIKRAMGCSFGISTINRLRRVWRSGGHRKSSRGAPAGALVADSKGA